MDVEEEEDDDVEGEDVEEKDRSQDQEAHCVRACAVETHMDISQEPFCVEIYRKNAGPQFRDKHFARACAVEMHMDISQEPFCVEIYRENAGRKHRALFVTVRTPAVWPHCLGKNVKKRFQDGSW